MFVCIVIHLIIYCLNIEVGSGLVLKNICWGSRFSLEIFLSQGLNPHHSSSPSHCSDHVGSSTCSATKELSKDTSWWSSLVAQQVKYLGLSLLATGLIPGETSTCYRQGKKKQSTCLLGSLIKFGENLKWKVYQELFKIDFVSLANIFLLVPSFPHLVNLFVACLRQLKCL